MGGALLSTFLFQIIVKYADRMIGWLNQGSTHLINQVTYFNLRNRVKFSFSKRRLLVQSQQWKHQNSRWNLLKVNNNDNRVIWNRSDPYIVTSEQISYIVLFPCWLWTSKCRLSCIIFWRHWSTFTVSISQKYFHGTFQSIKNVVQILTL